MFSEFFKEKIVEIFNFVLTNHTSDIPPEKYNHILDACFSIADFIVTNESECYIDLQETKLQSALLVLREVSKIIDSEQFDYEIDFFKNYSFVPGRMHEAVTLVKSYAKTQRGTLDAIKDPKFFANINSL